jgi:hypothetical protein
MPSSQIIVVGGASSDQSKAALLKAIDATGSTGTLIVSIGHGGSTSDSAGMFDLGPYKSLRIGGKDVANTYVDVFYDVKPSGLAGMSDKSHDEMNNPGSQRLKNWAGYQEICKKFKAVKPYKVVLLTCNVGNSPDFLRKVANDWGVVIHAYRRRAAVQQVKFSGAKDFKSLVFLEDERPNIATLTADQIITLEENIPYSPSKTLLVGPPP